MRRLVTSYFSMGADVNDERDVTPAMPNVSGDHPVGRNLVVTIGIDRYQNWRPLTNAVSDANGAQELFCQLGFERAVAPLRDDTATGAAMQALIVDQLAALSVNDNLVVFYAGHGGSQTHDREGQKIKTGYLIPSDADRSKVSTWIDLESWLRRIALLPPRHILVILDACYSGIALDPVVKWRDDADGAATPFETLRTRCSRRIITSALDNERALDSGPVLGHSLFTGCLIEALRGGITGLDGMTTGAEIAVWVRRRVQSYPKAQQTPDFGTFEFHDHGEMVIPVLRGHHAPLLPEPGSRSPLRSEGTAGQGAARTPSLKPRSRRQHRRNDISSLWREREWLMIVMPLIILVMIGAAIRSC